MLCRFVLKLLESSKIHHGRVNHQKFLDLCLGNCRIFWSSCVYQMALLQMQTA